METGLIRWRDRWTRAGVPTMPLPSGEKFPPVKGWTSRSPADMWAEVGGPTFRGNIAVIAGNGLVLVDCDAQETEQHVRHGLESLGLTPPEVSTPRGGRHFYVKATSVPDSLNFRHLARDIGPGELRANNAYCAAPCSIVNNRRYRFQVGSPEAIPALKVVDWGDLVWLLPPTPNVQAGRSTASPPPLVRTIAALPLPLVKRGMPALAADILQRLPYQQKGTGIGHYTTRSEEEQAVITMLVLAGWALPDIRFQFQQQRPGHYAKHANPESYLETSYQNAITELASRPTRLEIAELYTDAQAWPWPGRGGLLDCKVFLALLAVCWQFDSWTVHPSLRDLAQHAACSVMGARNALNRLHEHGLIHKVAPWKWESERNDAKATTWEVIQKRGQTCTVDTLYTVLSVATMRALWQEFGADELGAAVVERVVTKSIPELWRARQAGGLGRSAGAVYGWLSGTPRKGVELERLTGKGKRTVSRALRGWNRTDGSRAWGLQNYGLAERVNGGWVRGPADIAEVAQEFDASGAARKRRAKHKDQRDRWREKVERVRSGDVPEREVRH